MSIMQSFETRPDLPDAKPYCDRFDYQDVPVDLPRLTPFPRKLRIIGRAVSVRMEKHLWDDFEAISASIEATPSELARRIIARTAGVYGPTAAFREFIVRYWKAAAKAPHINTDTRVRTVLWNLGPLPQSQIDGLILRMQDALAPHLTAGRVKMIARMSRVDLCVFAAKVREHWEGTAPWEAGEDYIAGRALEALVDFEAAASRVA